VAPGLLVAELKRRGVFRALVGYGIAAFAVLQILERACSSSRIHAWNQARHLSLATLNVVGT